MLNIFGEKFRVCSGISINTEFADKLGQMVMDEIKKVFVDENLIFVDYTYSKVFNFIGVSQKYMRLNYLNLITDKGNIYSVKFKDICGNCTEYISARTYTSNCFIKIILVKYEETINPTEINWAMVKMYTIIQNGIEENKYGGILTILSHLEK